jgi:hypothetical protein
MSLKQKEQLYRARGVAAEQSLGLGEAGKPRLAVGVSANVGGGRVFACLPISGMHTHSIDRKDFNLYENQISGSGSGATTLSCCRGFSFPPLLGGK